MRRFSYLLMLVCGLAACDHGLVPPDAPKVGSIQIDVTYLNPGMAWPDPDAIFDLRFVAMPFIPRDTSDFLQLQLLAISDGLGTQPPRGNDLVRMDSVKVGTFVYSGIAEQFAQSLFSWRPVGLYEGEGGVFEVREGEVTELSVTVDFENRPLFPPQVQQVP